MDDDSGLPLAGLKVIEFTHMVMGPAAGLILGDLGADVIKIEPPDGDKTRNLRGAGAGYFPMYNRNKRCIAIDVKTEDGRAIVGRLIDSADILVENFREGAMRRLGFDYDSLAATNPGLIYCSEKGFLDGPYENRTALDEVAQMMGGLAYMTGPPGRPLRAGGSIIDVMGGMFGVIGILAALEQRRRTGRGQMIKASLFESVVFLMGQHMAQYAVTGAPAKPMPVRISAWAIYDLFETREGEQIFVGVVTDGQWRTFCRDFGLEDWLNDESIATNSQRVERRDSILPRLQELFAGYSLAALVDKLEAAGLPFAPVGKPEDMFEDPHLIASGGLLNLAIPGGSETKLPALPLAMAGARFGVRHDIRAAGQDTVEVLEEVGLSATEIDDFRKRRIIVSSA